MKYFIDKVLAVVLALLVVLTIYSFIFVFLAHYLTPDVDELFPDVEVLTCARNPVKEPLEAYEVQSSVLTLVEEVPETEETEFVSYYDYTEEELDLLARLISAEGETESYKTKLWIGSVVMNRVEDSNFPDTIREVIYQESQFSVTTHKIDDVVMIDRPASDESLRAAREVLDYGSVLPHDVQVFYADWCTERWVNSRKTYEVSDSTVFAYIYSKH